MNGSLKPPQEISALSRYDRRMRKTGRTTQKTKGQEAEGVHARFAQNNGKHPIRTAVPDGLVDNAVRVRRGGKLFYFNFDLAEEIGLITKGHRHRMTPILRRAILD